MFIIKDLETGKISNSNDYEMLEKAQTHSRFHPSYNCFWMLTDDGLLSLENSCGEIRGVNDKFKFIKYVEDEEG